MSRFLIENGSSILFIGDSITDCGRRVAAAPLGDGYVKMFTEIVTACTAELQLTVSNKGISGNKVDDLRNRWEDDVMRERFDWLSIMIGINDLHRQLRENNPAFSVAQFAENYEAILSRTVAARKVRLILIDPFYISTDMTGLGFRTQVLELIPQYIAVIDALADKYQALHLKTHDMFHRFLGSHTPDEFCPEPVHPYRSGHLAIALALFRLLRGAL